MSQTIREVCSDIINDLKSYNLDDRVSYRYIKNKLFDKVSVFIKQDADSKRLLKLSDLWQPIGCIDLEDVAYSECGDIGCKTLKRSVQKLPDSYQTGYGNLIKFMTIDYSKEYNVTFPFLYKDITNRPFPSKTKYYWLMNGYLYIPDSDVESVLGFGMLKESIEGECSKPMDNKFIFPDYILSVAKQETLKELLGSFKQITSDENPNLNNNIKN
jgi:hypothetical protein